MPVSQNLIIPCDQIEPPNNACKIKPKKVEKLIKSIKVNGLIQPPGVIKDGDKYRLVYGHHRLKAWQQIGHAKIEVRLVPSDANELSISLQENQVREPEDFEDTVIRVKRRAKDLGCTDKRAAEIENVNPAYISRAKKILKKLDSQVLALAKEKGVGFSVLYQLSSADHNRQMELIQAYIDGRINRDAIIEAIKPKQASRKNKGKTTTVERKTKDTSIKIVCHEETTYSTIYQELIELKKEIRNFERNGIPVRLLHEAMKGGDANVVLPS